MVDQLQDFLTDAEHISFKLLATLTIVVVAHLLRLGTRFIARKFTSKERYVARVTRVLTAIVIVVAMIAVLLVWFSVPNAILIAVIVIAAVVFLSMKDLVTDIFGFFYITTQQPFHVGDRIQVGQLRGEVYATGLLSTQIAETAGWLSTAQPTGRVVSIPNSQLLTDAYAVTTDEFPFVWSDLTLSIGHADDLELAEKVLLEAGQRELDYMIAQENAALDSDAPDEDRLSREILTEKAQALKSDVAPSVSMSIDGAGIELTLRFLCRDTAVATATTRLWRDIHNRLKGVDTVNYSPNTIAITPAD